MEQARAAEEDLYSPPMHYLDPNVSMEAEIESPLKGDKYFARVIMVLFWLSNNRTFSDEWREFFYAVMRTLLDGIYTTEEQLLDLRERMNRNPMYDGDFVGWSPDDITPEDIADFFEGE
jgi:hypothetical protein